MDNNSIGIQIKTYKNQFDYIPSHNLLTDFGESNTDKSFYRPDVSSARASLGSISALGSNLKGVYDFDDGIDNGDTFMTFLRSKSIDVTELDAAMQRVIQNAQKARKADIDNFLEENANKDKDEIIKALKSLNGTAAASAESQDSTQS